jgi:hypothetical protein
MNRLTVYPRVDICTTAWIDVPVRGRGHHVRDRPDFG